MIGAGILRAPGGVAQATDSVAVFFLLWIAGALYALLGALSLAELGAMIPVSGGQTVFVRRAFGAYPGFAVGWSDWISSCASVAAIAIVLGESVAAVFPSLATSHAAIACAVVLLLMATQWGGVKRSGAVQTVTSAAKAIAFAFLIGACFLAEPRVSGTTSVALAGPLVAVIALQSVIYTYDGWTAVLYFSGEVKEPGREIPRSMMLGLGSVTLLYLLTNLAFIYVLGLRGVADSPLVADTAAQHVFGARGTSIVRTLIAVALISAVSANLMMSTRVIYALGRDNGMPFTTAVNSGGTPTMALALSTVVTIAFAATGAFERVIAVAAFFFVANYTISFLSVFWLRRREPDTPRPYRAWGYPFSTATALLGSVAFLIAAVTADPRNSIIAVALLILSYPVFRGLRK
jgi:APA family basic amino acid/polyamine antiporter